MSQNCRHKNLFVRITRCLEGQYGAIYSRQSHLNRSDVDLRVSLCDGVGGRGRRCLTPADHLDRGSCVGFDGALVGLPRPFSLCGRAPLVHTSGGTLSDLCSETDACRE